MVSPLPQIQNKNRRHSQHEGSSQRRGEESSLCVLGYHLLPLFICCAAAERLKEWGREGGRGGLDCMFSSGSATLSPGCWGRGGGGRPGRQRRALEMWNLISSLTSSSFPPPPSSAATSIQSVQDSLRNRILSLQAGNSLLGGGGGGENQSQERGEIPAPNLQDWKYSQETENCIEADWAEQRGGEMKWRRNAEGKKIKTSQTVRETEQKSVHAARKIN